MYTVSVVIPVGPGHEKLAKRAIASAEAQSVTPEIITVFDKDGTGPSAARNHGLSQVQTDYVMFLDADDWLEPNAIARMLAVASRNLTRYVYSDWYRDSEVVETAKTGFAWCGGTWHPITALIPTNWAREVGGFDETLEIGGEDTDFYLKLITSMRCGLRVPEALVNYSPEGQRAKKFHKSDDFKTVMDGFSKKYGGKMACCGKVEIEQSPDGEQMEGDVLAIALWGGNRVERGRATGRRYPRTGNGKMAWVDPRDIDAAPTLWKKAPQLEPVNPDVPLAMQQQPAAPAQPAQIRDAARAAYPAIVGNPIQHYEPSSGYVQQSEPDVSAIIRMAQENVK